MNNKTHNFKAPVDVIKNPARNLPRPKQSFEPEYQRLGITPIQRGIVSNIQDNIYVGVDNANYGDNGEPLPFSADAQTIDNNEFVFPPQINTHVQTNVDNTAAPSETTKNTSVPQVGEYILMVNSKLLSSGSINAIENQVRKILYNEDETFVNQNITADDIVVLKRVEIKVGVFVGE